jgi:hypothetical protein
MLQRIGFLAVVFWLTGSNLGLSADRDPDDITILHDLRYRDGASKQWRLDLSMSVSPLAGPV